MEKSNEKNFEYRQFVEKHNPSIENALREYLPIAPSNIETEFNQALDKLLLEDEMRFRAILTMLGAELVEGKASDVLPSAIAVEYIFLSSKVFSKLSIFQNDENSNDQIQILVGLGLLNSAYPLVFVNHSGMPEKALAAHSEIVECVGASGLIGGLKPENNLEENSAIIRLAVRIGAILSGANYLELASLSRFAELIGDDVNENANFSNLEQAKRILVENFPSNEARSCMLQLTEYLAEK